MFFKPAVVSLSFRGVSPGRELLEPEPTAVSTVVQEQVNRQAGASCPSREGQQGGLARARAPTRPAPAEERGSTG